MEENRKYARWKIRRPARFKLLDEPQEEEEKMAMLRDISFVGAQFSLLESLRLNDKLDVFLEIPDENNPVHCQGKVVWQKSIEEPGQAPFICGLLFTLLGDRDKERIFQYINSSSYKELWNKWWEGIK